MSDLPTLPNKEYALPEREIPLAACDFPMVSIVIATDNSSHLIGLTLDSIRRQEYPKFEVLIIDSGSTDRTLEIVRNDYKDITRVDAVIKNNRYAAYNRGIALAQGMYILFLLPGDAFLSNDGLRYLLELAVINAMPDLVYGACLLHEPFKGAEAHFRPLSLEILKRGKYPTSLQSCLFKLETLIDLGKLDPSFEYRGGLDLLCRLFLKSGFSVASTTRVIIDFEVPRRSATRRSRESWETLRIIYKYFGFKSAFLWWIRQNHLKYFSDWLISLKESFQK